MFTIEIQTIDGSFIINQWTINLQRKTYILRPRPVETIQFLRHLATIITDLDKMAIQ